ncbi:hypothetical protein PQ676_06435 [Rickettsia felis]|nr:hypothetical protein [Rickettsia felis]
MATSSFADNPHVLVCTLRLSASRLLALFQIELRLPILHLLGVYSHLIPVSGVYPGPIDTDMAKDIEVKKETSANVALRVFDAMEQGILDITTDALSDNFISYLNKDPKLIEVLKKEFNRNKYYD